MDFYIDESGNSGDLIHSGDGLEFGAQPIFTLAAVGIEDAAALCAEVAQLRARHRVGGAELKSSALASKPAFARDLIAVLIGAARPLFVEVVDKRYLLCSSIVNIQLLPPGVDEGPDSASVRNAMADWLWADAPDHVLRAFVDACRAPADATVRAALKALASVPNGAEPMIARAIRDCAAASLEDFEMDCTEDEGAYLRYLPLPDSNKRGKPVWMLANLSSLTNIYARINLFNGRSLAGVQLVHDEQLQFDNILADAKAMAEAMSEQARWAYTPHSDYEFVEAASLVFANSSNHVGLQVADVLAGFVMRHVRDWGSGQHLDPTSLEAFRSLLVYSDGRTGIGVNFVVPTPSWAALHRAHLRL